MLLSRYIWGTCALETLFGLDYWLWTDNLKLIFRKMLRIKTFPNVKHLCLLQPGSLEDYPSTFNNHYRTDLRRLSNRIRICCSLLWLAYTTVRYTVCVLILANLTQSWQDIAALWNISKTPPYLQDFWRTCYIFWRTYYIYFLLLFHENQLHALSYHFSWFIWNIYSLQHYNKNFENKTHITCMCMWGKRYVTDLYYGRYGQKCTRGRAWWNTENCFRCSYILHIPELAEKQKRIRSLNILIEYRDLGRV